MEKHSSPPCGRKSTQRRPTGAAIAAAEEKLRLYLSEKGLKHSDQRLQMLHVVLAMANHFTVQDVLIELDQARASQATLYRNIKTLCDAGIVSETMTHEGNSIFELRDESHHDHIVCLDCGHIFEFHDPKIEKTQEQAAIEKDFIPAGHRHLIYARCGLLSSRNEKKKKGARS